MIGLQQKYLKLSFANLIDMGKVKRDVNRAVKLAKERAKSNTYYTELMAQTMNMYKKDEPDKVVDHMDNILDIR